jgi:hypothetical protein
MTRLRYQREVRNPTLPPVSPGNTHDPYLRGERLDINSEVTRKAPSFFDYISEMFVGLLLTLRRTVPASRFKRCTGFSDSVELGVLP